MSINIENVEVKKEVCLKKEAINCIDHMLVEEEVCTEVADALYKVVKLFGVDNKLYLGDGLTIKICDEK